MFHVCQPRAIGGFGGESYAAIPKHGILGVFMASWGGGIDPRNSQNNEKKLL